MPGIAIVYVVSNYVSMLGYYEQDDDGQFLMSDDV